MREIKFRVWDKEDKRMIVHEQDFIPLKLTSIGVLRLDATIKEDRWMIMPIERFALMQSTGLKDRNGVEIFEGDIIKQDFEIPENDVRGEYIGIARIRPSQGVVMIRATRTMNDFNGKIVTETNLSINIRSCRSVKIGNIHQHPELMESESND